MPRFDDDDARYGHLFVLFQRYLRIIVRKCKTDIIISNRFESSDMDFVIAKCNWIK